MKNVLRSLFVVLSLLVCVGAHAKPGVPEGKPICTPPLPDGCVQPQWGQIDPTVDGTDAMNATDRPATAMAPNASGAGSIRMLGAQYPSQKSSRGVAPKLIVDDGAKFKAETDALVSAIEHARFDADGNVVSGEERIAAAAEKLQRVAVGHQLSLYIKTRGQLRRDAAVRLSKKVSSINKVLVGEGGKPGKS